MNQVHEELKLMQEPEEVWAKIGSFDSIGNWHPNIEKLELKENGTLRYLYLVGGAGVIIERLEKIEDKSYSYSVLESPLPMKGYYATLKVEPDANNGCKVVWFSHFTSSGMPDADVKKTITGIYSNGFESIKKIFKD